MEINELKRDKPCFMYVCLHGKYVSPIIFCFLSYTFMSKHPLFNKSLRASFQGNKQGFTLIELLVVIAVIAILLGLAIPGFGRALEVLKAKEAQIVCNKVVVAIDEFEREWHIFPSAWQETMQDTGPEFLGPILGTEKGINRNGTKYLEADVREVPSDGIHLSSMTLYDPWDDSQPYRFAVDQNGDEEISRPSDYGSQPLYKSAICDCAGSDRNFNETKDNPTSWDN